MTRDSKVYLCKIKKKQGSEQLAWLGEGLAHVGKSIIVNNDRGWYVIRVYRNNFKVVEDKEGEPRAA